MTMTRSSVPAGLHQRRHPIDCEVRLLGLLDLQHDPHVVRLRPVERLRDRRYLRAGESGMEPAAGIQLADLLEAEVGREAVAVRRPVDGQVVQDDRLAVRGQHDIDLDRSRAGSLCRI